MNIFHRNNNIFQKLSLNLCLKLLVRAGKTKAFLFPIGPNFSSSSGGTNFSPHYSVHCSLPSPLSFLSLFSSISLSWFCVTGALLCLAIKHIAYSHPCRIHTYTQRHAYWRTSQFVDPIRFTQSTFYFNDHLKEEHSGPQIAKANS